MKRFIMTCLSCCFLLSISIPTFSQEGVAFIHGRGPVSYEKPEKAKRYWGDLVRLATRDYAMPTYTVGYDGTQFMQLIAPDVAKQIVNFAENHKIGDNELKIIAHSYGGVVLRYIMSNPSLDANFEKVSTLIKWVVTLGSPHLGTRAADMAQAWHEEGGWRQYIIDEFVSYNDAAKNLTTAQMKIYNESCILWGTKGCPPLPKPFYTVSGGKDNDLWDDFFWEGHREDLGLVLLESLIDYQNLTDGLVPEPSADGITENAVKWFATARNHHHLRNNNYTPDGEEVTLAKKLELALFNH